MFSKASRRNPESGFTLIEVVVAMVILAIGMLSLEALGITAARQVKYAEANSEHVVLALHHLEAALDSIQRGESVVCSLSFGYGTTTDSVEVARTITSVPPTFTVSVATRSIKTQGLVRPAGFMMNHQIYIPTVSGYDPC